MKILIATIAGIFLSAAFLSTSAISCDDGGDEFPDGRRPGTPEVRLLR